MRKITINLAVDNISGSNPNNLPNINIRGTSSLPMSVKEFNEGVKGEVNTPLIIMDGFEISLTKLMDCNDNDIESINILKDASATALYGSRGANGVIVIVSKRPVSGRLKVTGTIGLNLEMPDLTSYDLLHAADKLELERLTGLYVLEGYPTTTIERQEIYNGRLRKVLSGVDTDWLSKPLRTGVGQRYNLRMEGGNEEFRWSTSADYNDTQGAMKGSSRKVFNGSITLMYSIKNLIFKNQTNIGITNSRESNYGSFSNYANQQPYNAPYDENGNIVRYFDDFYANPNSRTQNPLYDATLNSFDKSKYQDISNNFSIEWNIFDGLKLRGQLGIRHTPVIIFCRQNIPNSIPMNTRAPVDIFAGDFTATVQERTRITMVPSPCLIPKLLPTNISYIQVWTIPLPNISHTRMDLKRKVSAMRI